MATIITRAGKGSPLTNAEVDANFNNLNNAKLELAGGTMTGAIAFAAGQTFPGAGEVTLAGTETLTNKTIAFANNTLTGVQPTLVSGTSIKTVNGTSVLGSGNIQIDGGVTSFNTRTGAVTLGSGDVTTALGFTPYNATNPSGYITASGTETLTNKTIAFANNTLTGVQPTLVSGTSIKTVNGNNLLGSGNISVTAVPAGSDSQVQFNTFGVLAASTAFTFNTGNNSLAVSGPIKSGLVTMSGGSGSRLFSVALGMLTLASNSTGERNTGVGYEVLRRNTIGLDNTGVGQLALTENTTGNSNTAVGSTALRQNTAGYDNTAFGNAAGNANTTGFSNTAIGRSALQTNSSGVQNTAVGRSSLINNTGDDNTAIGVSSLSSNTTGSYNTATGKDALRSNTTGSYNTAIGYNALYSNTTGSGNTAISPAFGGLYSPVFNPTTESNRFCMGSTSVTNAYIQVAWTVVSDARDKTDFAPVPHGLDFVSKLKPTAYRYKMTRESEDGHGPLRYGFKAQDVLELEGSNSVIVDAEDLEKLRFNDQSMIAVLVKAIQELKQQFDDYKASHP